MDENRTIAVKVIGVGGFGVHLVNRMAASGVPCEELAAVDTDLETLSASLAGKRLLLAGGCETKEDPDTGRRAAVSSRKELEELFRGTDLVVLVAGLGGGTGTYGASVAAELARRAGALTLAVVTTPFRFEGRRRMQAALDGLAQVEAKADSFVVLHQTQEERNFGLEQVERTLLDTVETLTGMTRDTGDMGLDLEELRTVLHRRGRIHVGLGRGRGEDRCARAAEEAISSPLLGTSLRGAGHVMMLVEGSQDLRMDEVDRLVTAVTEVINPDAEVLFAPAFHETAEEGVCLRVVSTLAGPRSDDAIWAEIEDLFPSSKTGLCPPEDGGWADIEALFREAEKHDDRS